MARRQVSKAHLDDTIVKFLYRLEHKPLEAVLKNHHQIRFWRRHHAPLQSRATKSGLAFLGLLQNPFCSENAEEDIVLYYGLYDKEHSAPPLHGWYNGLSAYQEIEKTESPLLVLGAKGAGKTATALWIVFRELRNLRDFPIYCPISDMPTLSSIGEATAKTLLDYLALHSDKFIDLELGQHAITYLWANFIANDEDTLVAYLRKAGLPKTGQGKEMEEGVRSCLKGLSKEPISDANLLDLLSQAYPKGYTDIRVILDWNVNSSQLDIKQIEELLERLFDYDIVGTAFLPEDVEVASHRSDSVSQIEFVSLKWDSKHLEDFLKKRLAMVKSKEDSIASWCDQIAKKFSPDKRLVESSGGTPAGLIAKGNELLRRIGEKQELLSANDLEKVLGPYHQSLNRL